MIKCQLLAPLMTANSLVISHQLM